MKFVQTTCLPLIICSAGLLSPADASEGIGFHGSFSAGSLFDAKDHFSKANWDDQIDKTMGRIGSQVDNSWEGLLDKHWELDDGKTVTINFKMQSEDDGLVTRASPRKSGVSETYVQFGGITPTGTLWGGMHYYDRENYIYTTDFFYTDYSGTGLGVKGLEWADAKWDFAYISANDDEHSDRNDYDAVIHAVHMGSEYGPWDVEVVGKYMPKNTLGGIEYAHNGIESTLSFAPDGFFWVPGGFSKLIFQVGQGLGSGDMLGAMPNNTSEYRKGSLYQKYDLDTSANYKPYQTKLDEKDVSYRAFAWGGWFSDNIQILPTISGQYNDYERGGNDSWYGSSLRVVFPVNDVFKVQNEVGYVKDNLQVDGIDLGGEHHKITIAPTFTIDTGVGPSPELRILSTYVHRRYEASYPNSGDDLLVGMQADMWW